MEKFRSFELELMKTYKVVMRYINWIVGDNLDN